MSEPTTAEQALAEAMDGCEDGYSRHRHREAVASVLAALRAAGFAVVPVATIERAIDVLQLLSDISSREIVGDLEAALPEPPVRPSTGKAEPPPTFEPARD